MNRIAIAPDKGIRVPVARTSQDCTNNGVSATHDFVTVVGTTFYNDDRISALAAEFQIDTPTKDAPAMALQVSVHHGFDEVTRYVSLVPLELDDFSWTRLRKQGHVGPCNGGNTVTSQTLAWLMLTDELGADFVTLDIHDRFETIADYNAMDY